MDLMVLVLVVEDLKCCLWWLLVMPMEEPEATAGLEVAMSPEMGGSGGNAPLVRGVLSGLLLLLLEDEELLLEPLWDLWWPLVPWDVEPVSSFLTLSLILVVVEGVVAAEGSCRLGCLSMMS